MDLAKQLRESKEFQEFNHESVQTLRKAFPYLKKKRFICNH